MSSTDEDTPLDLAGIGIGPFNLSLAALADGAPGLSTAFYEQRPAFHWHPGLLIEGATLQVPFLADLVTLADPTSPWSFLNYLRTRERLFPFYFAENFHIHRAEYDAYCRWASENIPGLHFGHQIDAVHWRPDRHAYELDYTRLDEHGDAQAVGRVFARNLALGIGTAPHVPEPLRTLADTPGIPVLHSADYLHHRDRLLAAGHITVIGSGQSGAEVFLDLLRQRPAGHEQLTWLARTPAFAPMEYSKLGLEHFTPDYTRYFHSLPQDTRDALLPRQWQLHKGIDHDTIAAVHDELYRRTLHGGWPDATLTPGTTVTAAHRHNGRIRLELEHREQRTAGRLTTDAVVLATGYRERPLDGLLAPLADHVERDDRGRHRVDDRYRLRLAPHITGAIHVQNAERHTHGVGAPDLGLAAWRSAVILNTLTGRDLHPLPRRTAFTTYGLTPEQGGSPSGPLTTARPAHDRPARRPGH
ncbi:lysine N(6)-hydroxylase/L-ornithine N(5)-oxygenase family protein [Streptomyces lycii]|uniref:L-lysine N6-monooxygenase MbtG n=1 Tax=Streptomyces lycii TaxID=2654337 RepID=A0ABQ7FFK9_9ACTN|nr:SidA/IucD/PvdA family monooxygenase [Streptomyces lycii]KAF4407283.1 SidA/IucD/PvdA family monooxygenase [Streptomyces lycii]